MSIITRYHCAHCKRVTPIVKVSGKYVCVRCGRDPYDRKAERGGGTPASTPEAGQMEILSEIVPRAMNRILDIVESRRRADEGIAISEQNPEALKELYRDGIRRAAERHDYFTADQVWECLRMTPPSRGTGSMLGSIFREAMRDRVIAPTDDFRRSERPEAHRKPLPVWRSLIYRRVA